MWLIPSVRLSAISWRDAGRVMTVRHRPSRTCAWPPLVCPGGGFRLLRGSAADDGVMICALAHTGRWAYLSISRSDGCDARNPREGRGPPCMITTR